MPRARGSRRWLVVCTLMLMEFPILARAADWRSPREDGLHDAESPAIGILQSPGEALSLLPPDTAGNKVDWIRALQGGHIKPRSGISSDNPVEILETEILMKDTSVLPFVLFPHKPHTQWLDCSNCHEQVFKSEAGANPIGMMRILDGEFCGVCHGAVSFPLTECNRCHSVSQKTVE